MLVNNSAGSHLGVGQIGYVTYIHEFTIRDLHSNIFSDKEKEKGIGRHLWIDIDKKIRTKKPLVGNWSFTLDLTLLTPDLNPNTHVI